MIRKQQKKYIVLSILLIILLSVGSLSGCKKKTPEPEPAAEEPSAEQAEEPAEEAEEEQEGEPAEEPEVEENAIDEDGLYNSKDDVALYLYTYGHLPSNYITKKEAKKLGWSGGSVERYGEKLAIGGDVYSNYEETLPVDADYHECDIDTWGKKKRGAKRIVWSDNGNIYYTEDHYESFELLYGKEGDD